MAPIQHRFSPYSDNGGSVLAIAGKDFCVIAADTRQSDGYSINSRYAPKAFKLSDKTVLATTGFHADGVQITRHIRQQMEWYKFKHNKEISCPATAQMVSNMMYGRRFFPYYTFNVIGGIDKEGRGAVYSFDPIGSYEREGYRSGGSASELLQPFLDCQIGQKNIHNGTGAVLLPLDRVIAIAEDAFTSATERDIYTGDSIEIFIVTQAGVEVRRVALKRD